MKLTPWFPSSIAPVHYGPYQVATRQYDGYWSVFNGAWHGCWATKDRAELNCEMIDTGYIYKWRGLAEPPK